MQNEHTERSQKVDEALINFRQTAFSYLTLNYVKKVRQFLIALQQLSGSRVKVQGRKTFVWNNLLGINF